MLKCIRKKIMCKFQEKRGWIGKCKGRICPRIQEKLDKIKRSLDHDAVLAGDGVWEVTDIGKCYVVDLRQRTCGCVCHASCPGPCHSWEDGFLHYTGSLDIIT